MEMSTSLLLNQPDLICGIFVFRLFLDFCIVLVIFAQKFAAVSWISLYTVIHNYGNPYEKWNIFVATFVAKTGHG